MSRVLTEDEVRDAFLHHVWTMIDYWDKAAPNTREKMEGLAFSLLVMLDGESMSTPGFSVKPDPHPDDKAFHQSEGENWWPEAEDKVDIAGGLHDAFYEFGRKNGFTK